MIAFVRSNISAVLSLYLILYDQIKKQVEKRDSKKTGLELRNSEKFRLVSVSQDENSYHIIGNYCEHFKYDIHKMAW